MALYYPRCRAALRVFLDDQGPIADEVEFHVIPKRATVHLTGFKDPDSFELTFDAAAAGVAAMPISPELVRAATVEIYMYQSPDGTTDDVNTYASDKNRRIVGLVDDHDLAQLATAGGEVTLQGQDYTAVLAAKDWDQTRPIPVGAPLDVTVQRLVDEATQAHITGRSLTVRYLAPGVAPIVNGTRAQRRGIPVDKSDAHYWDVIYRLCEGMGFECYVQGLNVIVTTGQDMAGLARQLAQQVTQAGLRDIPRLVAQALSGVLSTAAHGRTLVMGRNLRSLSIKRHLGKVKAPQIVIRSYDAGTGQVVTGKFPDDPVALRKKTATNAKTGKVRTTETDSARIYDLPGISDPQQARRIAETTYNRYSRSEAEIRFATKHLSDLNGMDMLTALPNIDPMYITFDPLNDPDFRRVSRGQRAAYLRRLGYEPSVADAIALNYDKILQLDHPYYLKELTLDWDHSTGISLDAEALNFVSISRDDLSKGAA